MAITFITIIMLIIFKLIISRDFSKEILLTNLNKLDTRLLLDNFKLRTIQYCK